MATLTLENVRKRFAGQDVLNGIDLALEDGELLVLLGPSGCGKSTLLNLIAGLDTVSGGAIRIDGRLMNDVPPKDRDVAMVFQSYALYPNMTVARNIGFGLEMRGVPRAERAAAVQRVAGMLQIDHLLDRKPAQLSGGQRQRVAMGRAIIRNPRIFLFDEPLSNLDAKLRVDMRTEIKRLHQRLGATIVYVTHDQSEAMTLATRIAVLKDGVIQQVDPPQRVYEEPANIYVAGFIGAPPMNLLPATLGVEDGRLGVMVRCLAHGRRTVQFLPLAGRYADLPPDGVGRGVVLGLRPEAITRGRGAPAGEPESVRIECRVRVLEPTGADTLTHIDLGDAGATARVKPGDAPPEGSTADFVIDMLQASLFDPETGRRL
ncbi:ABC transporter ATP-binding protein [Azospirillum thermophilum]|uniref:Sugar ABC transporter ATP-binding protein n=1 Tax=Azospirillum thermophilum TaxID=2202148 RepID=A0A2S2CVB3_9PROT|nr:ABC transporter ATP-binding protein [Azospirillum thermophilum]AWK88452.1 sugar ABC transporter ATP-binding protein [Azospirillum thermophilum]